MPGGPATGPEPPGKPAPPRSAARGGETPAWGRLAWATGSPPRGLRRRLWQPEPWANAGGAWLRRAKGCGARGRAGMEQERREVRG